MAIILLYKGTQLRQHKKQNQSQKQIIMRVSNLLIMGALSALVFTGCTNNDDNSEWLDSNSVTFNSRIDGLQTKASKERLEQW